LRSGYIERRENFYGTEWHVQLSWLKQIKSKNWNKYLETFFCKSTTLDRSNVITNVKIIAKGNKYWRAIPVFKSVRKFYFAYNILLQQQKYTRKWKFWIQSIFTQRIRQHTKAQETISPWNANDQLWEILQLFQNGNYLWVDKRETRGDL